MINSLFLALSILVPLASLTALPLVWMVRIINLKIKGRKIFVSLNLICIAVGVYLFFCGFAKGFYSGGISIIYLNGFLGFLALGRLLYMIYKNSGKKLETIDGVEIAVLLFVLCSVSLTTPFYIYR